MWSTGWRSGRSRFRGSICLFLGGIGAAWILAGCDKGQSPTEAARLAEARRSEAELTVKTPDVVDAEFLGSGPLIPRDGFTACPLQGFWSGYPRRTNVRIRVSKLVPGSAQAGIAGTASLVGTATLGALTITLDGSGEIDPHPGVNEVTVAEVPSPRAAGCSSDAGCVQFSFAGRGLLMGARVVEPRGRSIAGYVRDTVGRGVLGLCYIDARQIGGPENSLMSGGPGAPDGAGASTLTGLDLEAIRSVYASGLSPGAARSAFLAARLVNLQAGQLTRSP